MNKQKSKLILSLSLLVVMGMASTSVLGEQDKELEKSKPEPESSFSGNIQLGVGSVSIDNEENHKYGEYTGIENDDNHLILNFDILWQQESAYLEATGKDMGIDSRRSELETGQYGNFSLNFKHQRTPHLDSTNAATPYNGVGGNDLNLPAGFVTSNTTGGMTNLAASLNPITVRTDRTLDEITYSNYMGTANNLKLDLTFRSETKEGVRPLGGLLGEHGGFNDSIILPVPVDYKTDEIGAKISLIQRRTTYEAGIFFSKFRNEHEAVDWDVPFNATAPFPIAQQYPGTASTSLPVDNEHFKINFNVVSRLTEKSLFSALIELGKMEQDEEFLPYTVNPALATAALPRDSAEAEVETTHINLNYTARPNAKFNWRAKYRFYETDNKTPSDQFRRVVADTNPQEAVDSERDNPNHAYDYEQNEINLDGTFRLGKALSLNLGYEIDKIERSHREVDETEEQTIKAKIKSRLTKTIKGTFHIAKSEREADDYDPNIVFQEAHTDTYLTNVSALFPFWNHLDMRKFDVADRDRDVYGLQLDIMANMNTSIGVFYSEQNDDYDTDKLGFSKNENSTYGFDVDYAPNELTTIYFNYTREEFTTKQNGHSFNFIDPAAPPGPPAPAPGQIAIQAADPTRAWDAEHEDEIDTMEIGGVFRIWEEKLTLKASYIYSKAENNIEFSHGGNAIAFSSPPEDIDGEESKRQTIRLSGEFHKTENLGIEVGLDYDKLDYSDWQKAGIEAGSTVIDDVLPLTGEIPDNEVYFIYTTVNYKW